MAKVFAIHPGEILKEEFMGPLSLTAYRLAKELHVRAPRTTTSCVESAPLPQIPQFVWESTSVFPRNSG